MKKALIGIVSFFILLFSGVQCTFFEDRMEQVFRSPYILDLAGIQARGTIRAAVDNNSTSYYIYRGRRMGYEFELLRDLGKFLGVQVEFVVVSDIDQAFDLLEEGKVDILAINLENSRERRDRVAFTHYLGTMSTVIVGRKPFEKPVTWDEIGYDTIYVRKGTVYSKQLQSIKDSLQLDFNIKISDEHEETLIDQIADQKINWTIADRNIAKANQTYYQGLDVSLKVSEDGTISWAVRKNSPKLLSEINTWLAEKKKRFIPELYAKYFLSPRNSFYRANSQFSSLGGNRISVYDELIQENASDLGWDWRLLAALVYKESGFDTTALSYAGAEGLLQLMPVTLQRFGVENPNDPRESLRGGVKYLQYLDKFWMERVPESNERIKFILASYNIGQGHVEDAWRLTMKYGKNTQSWEDVSYFLNLKSDPEYYRDPVVRSGYAKGHIAVNYVRDILGLYESYRALINP
ncbi:membrane-bound lytic murein transglycosylase F [Algoriphagus boseongensis]|uniref:Membrane-bound lytic murein transglycosylase F n=1 Tax=Algoriphagus boseongensis TaxID=1442587 RepID=A0A4R6T313_9BACT|nr:transporter substrate-binding domain-containing protein [Algoriphagus boseongensis]TDQ13795.1 membrane-bound lytic murein transglycosylase F [Algoriphagus boseongensis]